jgi:biopolymer transport protein ExbD
MAELSNSQNKKVVPKVDLTAMVDLAFLLITFFMLTTSLSKPVAMDIAKPDIDEKDIREPWPASRTMTLLLGAENKIGWYMGETETAKPQLATFSQIRKIILEYKHKVAKANSDHPRRSNYKNFVDIMDEINLVNLKSASAIDDEHITLAERSFF